MTGRLSCNKLASYTEKAKHGEKMQKQNRSKPKLKREGTIKAKGARLFCTKLPVCSVAQTVGVVQDAVVHCRYAVHKFQDLLSCLKHRIAQEPHQQ